jgi:hypothetical protein
MSTACPVNEYKPFWGESKNPRVKVADCPLSAYDPLSASIEYADPTLGAVPAIGKLAKGKPAKPYPVMENAI